MTRQEIIKTLEERLTSLGTPNVFMLSPYERGLLDGRKFELKDVLTFLKHMSPEVDPALPPPDQL